MKDAAGRLIKIGDVVVYSSNDHVNAAEVTSLKPFKVQVISTTEFGTECGKEVALGNKNFRGHLLGKVLVINSNGNQVDFSEKLVKPYSEKCK